MYMLVVSRFVGTSQVFYDMRIDFMYYRLQSIPIIHPSSYIL